MCGSADPLTPGLSIVGELVKKDGYIGVGLGHRWTCEEEEEELLQHILHNSCSKERKMIRNRSRGKEMDRGGVLKILEQHTKLE